MPAWSGRVTVRLGVGDHAHEVHGLAASTPARAAAVAVQAGLDEARAALRWGVSAERFLGPDGEPYAITLSLTRDGT